MEKTETLKLPIEIIFDLLDKPETSGLMSTLRDMGFDQSEVSGNSTKVKYKGQFTGTSKDLKLFCQKVKSIPTGT